MVFALRASLSAVQIRSRRICASPKESIQRKGDPDAACSLRSEAFERGCRKGLPAPSKRDASLHRPYGLFRSKAPVLGAAYGTKPSRYQNGFGASGTRNLSETLTHLLDYMI
ncbi:hypothetical protein [Methylomonas koyamae]|uniref:hypothetical protein n=1 Tax=Methylomonas koyamae TaxID=702114 RepID=UPI0012F6F17D|nr:hypothetical protein [Methylomonas koyamae]